MVLLAAVKNPQWGTVGYQNINLVRNIATSFNLLHFTIYKPTKHRHTVEIHPINTHTTIGEIMNSFGQAI